MNPARLCHLFSSDVFDRVDDPKNHLKKCITPEIMQRFLKAGVPPHDLVLKVNDICIVLRNLSKRNGLSNNVSLLKFFTVEHALHSTHSKVRVRIVNIQFHTIIVETLGVSTKKFAIPRIRFKVSMPFGKSFTIVRTQFPLRVAYCLTLNKSQSQTFEKAVVDVCREPFCHGQFYVAMSRVRESDGIMLFCEDSQLIGGGETGVIVTNVVYPSLLLSDSDFLN